MSMNFLNKTPKTYQILQKFECFETTAKELVDELVKSKGDLYCLSRFDFIDPSTPDLVMKIHREWDWIKWTNPNRKLLLVKEISSEGRYERSRRITQ